MQSKNAVGKQLFCGNILTTSFVSARRASIGLLMLLGLSAVQDVQAVQTAGTTAGSFTVTPTGGASYSIPIAVPPGTAGMVPSLALVYNSQANDGLLGMGWKLSGLSVITRCPKTYVQDGVKEGISYTSADKYCLDGQRLVVSNGGAYGANGTEYRTERETFSKVISYGAVGTTGPAYFKVWTKAGQIIEFGNTADSAIEAQGKTAIRTWAVNKVTDTKGNYLTVIYIEDAQNGQYYPLSINYTGHDSANRHLAPYSSVQFGYEARADANPVYEAGSLMKGTLRLNTIRTYAKGNVWVKDYRLVYENSVMTGRSRLISLTECDGGGAAAICLRPTTFEWAYAGVANGECTSQSAPGFCGSNIWTGQGIYASLGRWVDLNGDGRADYITSNLAGTSYVSLSAGGDYVNTTWAEPAASPRGAAWLDMNADGKADMVTIDANGVMSIAYSTGSGYATPVTVNLGTTIGVARWEGTTISLTKAEYRCVTGGEVIGRVYMDDSPYAFEGYVNGNGGGRTGVASPMYGYGFCPDSHFFADLNGDGKPDYLTSDGNGNHYVVLSTDTGYAPLQTWTAHARVSTSTWAGYKNPEGNNWVDLNGDGKSDYVTNDVYGNHYVSLSTGTGYVNQTWTGHGISTSGAHWADLNGDGKTDYVTNDANGTHYVSISTGTCYVSQTWAGHGISTNGKQWIDLNGDGKADYVTSDTNGNHYVSLSTGSGYMPGRTWTSAAPLNTGWNWVDLNGEGIADLVTSDTAGNHKVAFSGREWSLRDGISKITNGLGATTEIEYAPLSSALIEYQKEATGTYPTVDVQAPMFVVTKVLNSNGVGTNYVSNYSYVGAKAHAKGGGFLGFRVVNSTDAQTGIKSSTTYNLEYPYQGLILNVEKRTAAGALLNQASNTWAFATNPAWGGQYHVPKLSQSIESSYELATGSLVSTLTTGTDYDAFGNPTTVTTSTGDGYSKTSTNTYFNDETKWFLGRLTSAVVASTAPDTVPTVTPAPSAAAISIAALSADKAEGNSGTTSFTFTVARSGNASGTSSVHWAVSGSGAHAANAGDFVGGALPSGTLTFAAGQSSQTLTVNVQGDALSEFDAGFTVTLSAPVNAALGTSAAVGNIRNDDLPVISITALSADKAEGNSGTTLFTFTVACSGVVINNSTVNWAVTGSGSSPANAGDFVGGVFPSGTLTFAAGQSSPSQTLTINVQGDTVSEFDAGFTATLSTPANALLGTSAATGAIRNDDPPVISITALSADKAEGNSGATPFTFTVTRTGNTSAASSVNYGVSGSGAHPANVDDFVGSVWPSGTLSFAAGQTSQTLTINVQGNTIYGGDDEFTVTLSNPGNAVLGTGSAIGVIRNDDTMPPPVISIAALSSDKLEGDSGATPFTFTLSRSGMSLAGPSTVQWTVSGAADAADFVGGVMTGTVGFAANQASQTLTVNVQGDTVFESDEGFTVTLSAPTDATLGTATTATGVIRNEITDAQVIPLTITANRLNYNLKAEAIGAGWNQVSPLRATVTVNAGVYVGGGTTAGYAFDTGTGFTAGTTLTLVNNGFVIGAGGAGGYSTAVRGVGGAGSPGGPALRAQYPLTIYNYGTVGGGGGGGGGCGFENCGGGGGGRGLNGGVGGSGGYWGGTGGTGTATAPGAGGSGNFTAASGGNLGMPGQTCTYCGAPGAAGAATSGNANITWIVPGTRSGALQ